MNVKHFSWFKMIFILSILLMGFPKISKAQTVESTIAALADDALSDWSSSWYYDKYNLGSATVSSYRETSSNEIQAECYFKFSRMGKRFTARFTVRITVGSSRSYVSRICYTDPSTDQSDCYTP